MKLIKIALSTIALLILLLVAAVILLPQFIDPNDYKDQITDTIQQKTGLEATIDGDLSLSVFPWLGVSTGHIVLKQPRTIQQSMPKAGNFVDVQAIDIKMKLVPLFSRKVEIDTILLKQPRIEFVVNSAGKNSLVGLQQTSTTASAPNSQNPVATQDSTAESAAIVGFTIAGINISDGLFIFDDQQTKTRYELTQLTINSGNILETSAPFSISGSLSGHAIDTVTFALDSELNLNKDTMAVTLNDLRSSIQQGSNKVDTKIDNIDYQHANAKATINNIDVNATAENYPLSLIIPSVAIDIKKTHISIPKLNANSNGVKLSGNVEIKNWNKVPMVIGDIKSNTINLQDVLQKLGIDYVPSNASALKKVSFNSHFNATANGASLQKAKITVDNTVLTGDVAIVNFAKPKYRFDLALNEIVIDDYLPITTDAADNTNAAKEKPPTATEALAAPIILLKDIYANGVFKADKITANKIKLTNSVINIVSTDSTVTITPTVDLYKGKLAGSTILKRGKNPTLLIKNTLTGVDLLPLLTDAEITDQFSGTANINTNITVNEKNSKPYSKGAVVLSVKNGAVKGVDIKKVLDDAQATIDKLRGKSVNKNTASNEDETRFAEMSATLLIDNDIITNNDLSMKAPLFRINGQGTINTAAQTLNYLTSIVIVNTNSGQGGESLSDLKGVTIPVRFTGSLNAPKYAIDTKALLKANTGEKVKEKKEELKDKLKKKLFDKLF